MKINMKLFIPLIMFSIIYACKKNESNQDFTGSFKGTWVGQQVNTEMTHIDTFYVKDNNKATIIVIGANAAFLTGTWKVKGSQFIIDSATSPNQGNSKWKFEGKFVNTNKIDCSYTRSNLNGTPITDGFFMLNKINNN